MGRLIIKDLIKSYKGEVFLDNISLSVGEGETVSILGASGSGKTTLFNIISGIESADSGEVTLNGKSILLKPGNVSYMPQDDLLLPYKTMIDNVSLPLLINKMKRKDAHSLVLKYFPLFRLCGCEKKYPHEVSGGMRQRAALLRTYMYNKETVLLDEPFCSIDNITKNGIYKWYIEMKNKMKSSTLLITHDIDEALILSDKIYVLSGKNGRLSKAVKINNNIQDFFPSENFINYKKEILSMLKV